MIRLKRNETVLRMCIALGINVTRVGNRIYIKQEWAYPGVFDKLAPHIFKKVKRNKFVREADAGRLKMALGHIGLEVTSLEDYKKKYFRNDKSDLMKPKATKINPPLPEVGVKPKRVYLKKDVEGVKIPFVRHKGEYSNPQWDK